jgi:hypothetical protein
MRGRAAAEGGDEQDHGPGHLVLAGINRDAAATRPEIDAVLRVLLAQVGAGDVTEIEPYD